MIERQRQELLECARALYHQQMQTSDGGNISVRRDDVGMLIKGSKSSFATCTTADFVVADFDGQLIQGDLPPSKESPLHGAIYRRFTDAGAIVHCHSPCATACAAVMDQLVFSTYHSEIKLILPVKVHDTGSYAVAPQEVEMILAHYDPAGPLPVFLLRKHGLVAVGRDLPNAHNIAELVEETAKIHVLSKMLGQ